MTNAGAMISFMITGYFIFSNGSPKNYLLERIIGDAASRMRMLRKLIHDSKPEVSPDEAVPVDTIEMLEVLKELHTKDEKRFAKAFNRVTDPVTFLLNDTFDEPVTCGATLPRIKAKVEARLQKCSRCAISVSFEGHVISGCFDNNKAVIYSSLAH